MSDFADQAVELARREVTAQTLPVTRQIYNGREPARVDGELVIDRVEVAAPGMVRVYFPFQEEPRLHFVVPVRLGADGAPELGMTYWEASVLVWLVIASDDLHPDDISRRVGLPATEVGVKGERRHPTWGRPYACHTWRMDPMPGIPGGIQEKLAKLFEVITPHADRVAAIGPSAVVTLSVVYAGWRGDPQFGGIWLTAEQIGLLSRMNARLDVDLYAVGEGELGDGE